MTSSSREETDSDMDKSLFFPRTGRRLLTGGGKPSSSASALKRKKKSDLGEDIPTAASQPEDDLVSDALTAFSDGNARRAGRGPEKDTTAEMSDPESYKTPHETPTMRNNRLQRIRRRWAVKWFRHENFQSKYQILFAFNPPWSECIAVNVLGENDRSERKTTSWSECSSRFSNYYSRFSRRD